MQIISSMSMIDTPFMVWTVMPIQELSCFQKGTCVACVVAPHIITSRCMQLITCAVLSHLVFGRTAANLTIRRHIIEQRFGSEPIPPRWRLPFLPLFADDEYPEFEGRVFEGWRVQPDRLMLDRTSQRRRNVGDRGARLARFTAHWNRVLQNMERFGDRYRPRPDGAC